MEDESKPFLQHIPNMIRLQDYPIYTSPRLSDRAFRLLIIHPSQDRLQSIACSLCPYDIDAAPPYEALSYVWGANDPSTEVVIQCNGKKVSIGANLADALRQLRLPEFGRIIWADALCICQADNEEKSKQIPLMEKIYSQASQVVVWLGHGDQHMIHKTVQALGIIGDACRQFGIPAAVDVDIDIFKGVVVPAETFSPIVCKGLAELYVLPYFFRIWCVQEVRLAQQVVMLWDEEEFIWNDVGLTAWWIRDNDTITHMKGIYSWNAWLMFNPIVHNSTFLQTLNFYRRWQATDPRDKVYGLLSLMKAEVEAKAIKVDYNLTMSEVNADTALSIIKVHSQLTAFSYVAHPLDYHEVKGIRSWAPMWDLENFPASPLSLDNKYSGTVSACKRQPVRATDSDHVSFERLCLTGVFYDLVTRVHAVMAESNIERIDRPYEVETFSDIFREAIKSAFPTFEDTTTEQSHRLARTLTAGRLEFSRTEQDSDVAEKESYYLAFKELMQRCVQTENVECEVSEAAFQSYQNLAHVYCRERRIFRLHNGSCGIGPQCMRPGDVVVVLYGGDFPFVLRPKGDSYLLMGAAYVDEVMCGELVDDVTAGKRHEQEFYLV